MQSLEDMLFLEFPFCSTEKTFLFPFIILHIFSVMEAVSFFVRNKALYTKNVILHHWAPVL